MVEKTSDLVQGTLDRLILKTRVLEPMPGYGIAVRLEQMSMKVFRVNAGSVCCAAAAATGGTDPKRMKGDGEQPAREVLLDFGSGAEEAEQRDAGARETSGGDCANSGGLLRE